jgi:recombination protein RecT
MSVDTTELTSKITTKAAKPQLTKAEINALEPKQRIYHYMERQKNEIAKALPSHLTAARMARICLTLFNGNEKLLACSVESMMGAVMQASQLGLEPSLLGHCYFIPYGDECQMQIGYKGMLELARRSGNISTIVCHEVYLNDFFKLSYGLKDDIQHIPWHVREDKEFTEAGPHKRINKDGEYEPDDPKNLRGVYAVCAFKDGGYQVHYMPLAEVERHKLRSKTWKNGPWQTDYVEMVKKTCIRGIWKMLPISVEIARGVEASDGTVKTTLDEDMTNVTPIDVDWNFANADAVEPSAPTEEKRADAPPAEEVKVPVLDADEITPEKIKDLFSPGARLKKEREPKNGE